jgi:hypothetical protein
MRATKVKNLVKFMEDQVMLVLGAPEVVVSDNGSQVIGKLFTSLLKKSKYLYIILK